MGDLLLRTLSVFLAPAPIAGFRRSRVALRRRGGGGGYGLWRLCRQSSVGASELDLMYSSVSSDGSVVFRFGTAGEIAEYFALKQAEAEGIAQVEDGRLEENVVTGGKEESEGFADEVLDMNLPVEDLENLREDGVDCASDSSATLRDERISSSSVGVFDVTSLDIISNLSVEEPCVHEDKDGSLRTGKVGVVQNSRSDEIAVESVCENKLSTPEKTNNSDGDYERTLGKENVSVESISVLDDNSECYLEKDNVNVENTSSSVDDFGGSVGKENMYIVNSNVSDENADGNAFKEFVVVRSIISDEELESYAGDQSTIVEGDIIVTKNLDPRALEPDVTVSLSLEEALRFVDKEDVPSHSIDESINSSEEISVSIAETNDESGYGTDSNGTVELSTIEETRISVEDIENDDKEIPVVNGTLTSNKEMAWDNNTEYVNLQKTSNYEVIHKENTQDFSSLLGSIQDAVFVAEQPSADEISNQKGYFQTSDAAGSLLSVAPANLSTTEGDLSNLCSDKTNVIQDTVAVATSSTNQEDTDGNNSVAAVPVASQLENESILDEKINFAMEEDLPSSSTIDSMNLTAEKATPTSEGIEVSEADILRNSVTAISDSKATEQCAQVADREEAVRLCLSIGAALLPKTFEALTGGEDAYFIAGETWFGVADGVGRWSLEGIDAGLYGHELMECCRRIVSDGGCSPTNTKEVLTRSAAEATLPGSATVLVAYFDGQVLHASNIGDTGFVIVRNGVVLSRSSPTVYDFHFPHQIQKGDDPLEFVEMYEIELNEGDIIVAATDGLFDNMYDQEIASIVTKSLQVNMSPEEMAAVLAVKAQEIGKSTLTRSPFADAAQAAGYASYTGGKLDDVAVIVSVVQKKKS